MEEILRKDGVSAYYKALVKLDDSAVNKVAETNTLLTTVVGQT